MKYSIFQNSINILIVLLIALYSTEAAKNKLRSNFRKHSVKQQDKQQEASIEESEDNQIDENFIQSVTPQPELKDFSKRSYNKQDFYLWEEGVTNLAYDDFMHKTTYVPNIEYLGAGYNIAYANPISTEGIDPGYTSFNVFEANYQEDKLKAVTMDYSYFLPDGVNLNTETTCQISLESSQIEDFDQYKLALSDSISVKGSYYVDFQANYDTKKTQETLSSTQTTIVKSEANCKVHNLSIDRYVQPKWSKSLTNAFDQILKSKSEEQIWSFFDTVGTHVTIGVELGARYGYFFELNKSLVQQMTSKGYSVGVGASKSFSLGKKFKNKKGTAGIDFSTEFEDKSEEGFKDALNSWKQISIGALPSENNDAAEWAQTVYESPVPIRGTFINWSEFLKKYNLGNTKFNEQQLDELSKLFEDAMGTYCTHLKQQGVLQECGQVSANLKYNVPGGKIYPGVDYTKIGGNVGYNWERLEKQCLDVAVDSIGYVYCVIKSDGNDKNEIHRYEIQTKKWTKLGFIHGQNIDAENGIIIVRGTDNQPWAKNFNTDPDSEKEWTKVGEAYAQDVCTDENGAIITAEKHPDDQYWICMHRDYVDKRGCVDINAEYVTCANGKLYYYDKDSQRDQVLSYNKVSFGYAGFNVKTLQQNIQNYRDGCITKAGWGYKLGKCNGDRCNMYYMEDIWDYENTGSLQLDGIALRIACASTTTGPILVHIGFDGTFIRVAE